MIWFVLGATPMALQMARPYKHPKTGIYYYRQKTPADLRGKLGDKIISRSLRTRDPQEAKIRNANEVRKQALIWDGYRKAPKPLTFQQIVALSGTLYHDLMAARGAEPWEPGTWEAALALADRLITNEQKESWFGPSVDNLLLENGIVTDEQSRWRLVQEFERSFRQAHEQLLKRSRGDFSPDPRADRFPAISNEHEETPRLSILGLFKLWERDHLAEGKSARTVGDYRQKLDSLCEFAGDSDPAKLTGATIADWCDYLRHEKGLAARTISTKYLAAVKVVFNVAVEKQKLTVSPAKDVSYRFSKNRRRERSKGYTDAEARGILKAARSKEGIGNWATNNQRAVRWGPWICAFTGARITEIMQLRKEDLVYEAEIPCLRITPEAGSVKSGHFRIVPIHPQLVEEGLVEFIQSQRDGPIFYKARSGTPSRRSAESPGGKISIWLRQVVGITDKRLQPNHAWRHRFKTLARDADMDPEYRDAIQGHEDGRAASDYGETTVKALYREICKLPRVDV